MLCKWMNVSIEYLILEISFIWANEFEAVILAYEDFRY